MEWRPCEDTGRRWPSMSEWERSQRKPTLLTPWSWTSSLQNFKRIHFCCINYSVCVVCYSRSSRLTQWWRALRLGARKAMGRSAKSGRRLVFTLWVVVLVKEMRSFSKCPCHRVHLLSQKAGMCPGQVTLLVGTPTHRPKGCGFDPRAGHIFRLWVRALVGVPRGSKQSMFLFHINASLSLPLSL